MQPKVITIPDDIRDAFDAACCTRHLDRKRPLTKNAYDDWQRQVAEVLQEVFFPLHPTSNQEVLQNFQETLLGMVSGVGTPVMRIDNLPPVYWEAALAGLSGMFEYRQHPEYFHKESVHARIDGRKAQRPHMDGNEPHTIRMLYCHNAGWPKQPTVFITADEVLQAMTCEKMSVRFDSTLQEISASGKKGIYEKMHETLVDQFLITPRSKAHAFLYRNPHYAANRESPEFLIKRNYINAETTSFLRMAEQLHALWSRESRTSTEPHSVVLWNNEMILHGKGKASVALPRFRERQLFDINARFSTAENTKVGGYPSCPLSR